MSSDLARKDRSSRQCWLLLLVAICLLDYSRYKYWMAKEYIVMEGRIFGYARVSSVGQNLDRQLIELRKYVPCNENIIVDKESGKNLQRRKLVMLREEQLL